MWEIALFVLGQYLVANDHFIRMEMEKARPMGNKIFNKQKGNENKPPRTCYHKKRSVVLVDARFVAEPTVSVHPPAKAVVDATLQGPHLICARQKNSFENAICKSRTHGNELFF